MAKSCKYQPVQARKLNVHAPDWLEHVTCARRNLRNAPGLVCCFLFFLSFLAGGGRRGGVNNFWKRWGKKQAPVYWSFLSARVTHPSQSGTLCLPGQAGWKSQLFGNSGTGRNHICLPHCTLCFFLHFLIVGFLLPSGSPSALFFALWPNGPANLRFFYYLLALLLSFFGTINRVSIEISLLKQAYGREEWRRPCLLQHHNCRFSVSHVPYLPTSNSS